MLNSDLLQKILLAAKYEPFVIQKVLTFRPALINLLVPTLSNLSFEHIIHYGYAGFIYPKVILDELEKPPLDFLAFSPLASKAEGYGCVNMFRVYVRNYRDRYRKIVFQWCIEKSILYASLVGNVHLLR